MLTDEDLTDEDLLVAWRAGDSSAANELIERYFAPLSRFFRSKVGDDCNDLVQETFVSCVETRERVDDRLWGFRSYLFGIARHRLIDHFRRNQRGPSDGDLTARSVADLRTTPSQHMMRAQRKQLLWSALQRLPLDVQITVELTYWEGLSGSEVAEITGVSPHTVRSRLARAREQLHGHLQGAGLALE